MSDPRKRTHSLLHLAADVLLVTVLAAVGGGHAQDFLAKPLRILTAETGGGSDVVARIMASALTKSIGQQVVVENRPGLLSVEAGAKAPADGYTLILSGSLWIFPLLQKVSFDPIKDFAPIALVASTPNVLATHPSLPVKSTKELIALAKTKPGELNYGSGPPGSTSHLAAELFNIMAGVRIIGVPFRGNGPALIALLSGELQLMFGNAAGIAPHVKSGRVRALAVTSATASALVPGLPTIASSGLVGYEMGSAIGIFAPAGVPPSIIARLNQEIVRVIKQPDVNEKLLSAGTEAIGSSPAEFGAFIKSDMAHVGQVISTTGIGASR